MNGRVHVVENHLYGGMFIFVTFCVKYSDIGKLRFN